MKEILKQKLRHPLQRGHGQDEEATLLFLGSFQPFRSRNNQLNSKCWRKRRDADHTFGEDFDFVRLLVERDHVTLGGLERIPALVALEAKIREAARDVLYLQGAVVAGTFFS